jgi:hypothetical protein
MNVESSFTLIMNSRILALFLCVLVANCQFNTMNLRGNQIGSSSYGGFNGFNDSFKNQMAVLLGEVTNANTP